jgi:hypothetical protein
MKKYSQKLLKIDFLTIFLHLTPVLYSQKKNVKNIKKKETSHLCPGLYCVTMDPKIFEKNRFAKRPRDLTP